MAARVPGVAPFDFDVWVYSKPGLQFVKLVAKSRPVFMSENQTTQYKDRRLPLAKVS